MSGFFNTHLTLAKLSFLLVVYLYTQILGATCFSVIQNFESHSPGLDLKEKKSKKKIRFRKD